jgi:hypothetical protein
VTVHPSALLRLPPGVDANAEFEKFVADLRLISESWKTSVRNAAEHVLVIAKKYFREIIFQFARQP